MILCVDKILCRKNFDELKPGDIFIAKAFFPQAGADRYSLWKLHENPYNENECMLLSSFDYITREDEKLYYVNDSPFGNIENIDGRYAFYTVDVDVDWDEMEKLVKAREKPGKLTVTANSGWVNEEEPKERTLELVRTLENKEEHAYSDKAVKDLLSSIDDNLSAISKWMKSVDDRIKMLEKRERFTENLNNQLDFHDDGDKNKLIEASRCIEGYFDRLADDGFPITPWSDEIVCIPSDTKHYEYDPASEEFKENGEYTNYACLVKIKSIMQNNGIVWGSIAYGAADELTWFNLTRIKDSFTITDAIHAVDCIYKIGDDDIEPMYIQTYHYDPEFHEFFNGEKKDMGGIKDITITATNITKIEDNPVALVKIRCRDDEEFTGTWIKFTDLVRMD